MNLHYKYKSDAEYKSQLQWNLIITATYGLNFSGCYIKVAALQRFKCIESHHLGLN